MFSSEKTGKIKISRLLFWLGLVFIFLGTGISLLIFKPVLQAEVNYRFSPNSEKSAIEPVNREFAIVIPKISANAPVIADVDPNNASEYQQQLTRGVAHAKGTALPDKEGNVFIFAHSATDFFQANRYNAIFYLLNKLVAGDEIFIYYRGLKYRYLVTEKNIVAADRVDFLRQPEAGRTLTLMTCWPAGTTLKRLIVQADISPEL